MRVIIDKDRITWRKLQNELVLMHLDTGAYYSLNETGVFVWQRLADGMPPEKIVEEMTGAYEVEAATARDDIERLINELAVQGLVDLVEETTKAPARETEGSNR